MIIQIYYSNGRGRDGLVVQPEILHSIGAHQAQEPLLVEGEYARPPDAAPPTGRQGGLVRLRLRLLPLNVAGLLGHQAVSLGVVFQ
jgi:hypothetical protein